jgi:chorismate mutase
MFAQEQEQTMYGLSDLLLQLTSERRKYGRFLAMGRAKSDQLALPVRESSDTCG